MKWAWKCGAILALAALPWLAGRSHPFLYDDVGMIQKNAFLENPENIAQVLTGRTLADSQVINGRRPAVLATYFLDRALYGLRPAGWRATSLLLHLGCAALLAGLVWRLTRRERLSLGAAWLFALHPIASEAVHAPGFRADVLCLVFVLLFIHAFLTTGPREFLFRALGLFALAAALLSKETAVVAPLLLGALMFLFPAAFPATPQRRWIEWSAAMGLATAFFVLWWVLPTDLQAAGGIWNGESFRFPETIFSAPALWTRTLRLLLVPWPLNVTPGFVPMTTLASARLAWGGAWLLLAFVGIWKARKAVPELALAGVWMLVFFLPVANVWPLLHPVGDRYFYPIVPGFAIAVAWVVTHPAIQSRRWGMAALTAVYVLLLLLRLDQWKTPEKLWTAAYFQNSQSATAATWLGLLREEAGDAEGSREFYKTATEINPHAIAGWINWGILEGKAENWAESERLLRIAVDLQPHSPDAQQNLATCLALQGRSSD